MFHVKHSSCVTTVAGGCQSLLCRHRPALGSEHRSGSRRAFSYAARGACWQGADGPSSLPQWWRSSNYAGNESPSRALRGRVGRTLQLQSGRACIRAIPLPALVRWRDSRVSDVIARASAARTSYWRRGVDRSVIPLRLVDRVYLESGASSLRRPTEGAGLVT